MEYYIKRLKEKLSNVVIYPQTVASAVYLTNNNTVEQEFSKLNSSIPKNLSELNNDEGYITDVSDKADASVVGNKENLNADIKEDNLVSAINKVYDIKLTPPEDGKNNQILSVSGDGYFWMTVEPRKLNSFTIRESTYNVTRTFDDENNLYNLKNIVVTISNPSGINGGANSYAYIYDSNDVIIGGIPLYFFASSNAVGACLEFSLHNGYVSMESSGWTSASYSPTLKSYKVPVVNSGNIAKISISSNGFSFNTGTKFEIFGVDA